MRWIPLRPLVLMAVMALILAACGGAAETGGGDTDGDTEAAADTDAADTDAEAGDEGDAAAGGEATMVFGTSADPQVLDGILVSDGESLRALDQMMEGLVGLTPGTTEIEPVLATEWETSDDGLEWTFQLREGVTFHDGEPFDAEAVCFNFDRWHTLPEEFRAADATYYYQTTFQGFEGEEGALYDSCTANGELEVTITLQRPSATFLNALTLTNFTIASPAALEEFGANEGEVDADGVFQPTGSYGRENPTGTGPFQFVEWRVGDRLIMERNPNYWGEIEGNIQTLIFRPISDPAAQLQALQTGEIQGYDLVAPEDFETIRGDENLQLIDRPAFNVGYVGFTQTTPPLDDFEVRRAIAHAIDRQEIVDAFYVGQGQVADIFQPPALTLGYTEDVTTYEYDPELARQILTDAGYELPLEIPFAFPTDVSRPYMPNPQQNAEAMAAQLEEAGFSVQLDSATWTPDYISRATNGEYGLYLLGWTGDFADPDNFIGTFFQTEQAQWGFDDPEVRDLLDQAEATTDESVRDDLYQRAHQRLMGEILPGLPYVHTKPALAFTSNVQDYAPSPVSLEPFSVVSVTE